MQVKLSLGILAVMGALVSTVAVPSASAQTPVTLKHGAELEPIPAESCGFAINVFQIVGPQKVRKSTEHGESVETSSGRLVLKFYIAKTKKYVVEDVSGTVKTVYHNDGSIEQIADGRNWWALGEGSKKNTGRPGLFITSGPVDLRVVPPTVLTLTTLGTYQRDLCKALR